MSDETKTETKTIVATWVAFLASGAAITALQGLDVSALPTWAQVAAGSLVTAGLTWLAAFNTRHKPTRLSRSAREAVQGIKS
jgi:hypothetical protein